MIGTYSFLCPKGYLKTGSRVSAKLAFSGSLKSDGIAYSGLNLNQDKAASRRQYTRYGKARQRCTGLNLIHYSMPEWFCGLGW